MKSRLNNIFLYEKNVLKDVKHAIFIREYGTRELIIIDNEDNVSLACGLGL